MFVFAGYVIEMPDFNRAGEDAQHAGRSRVIVQRHIVAPVYLQYAALQAVFVGESLPQPEAVARFPGILHCIPETRRVDIQVLQGSQTLFRNGGGRAAVIGVELRKPVHPLKKFLPVGRVRLR